MKKLICICISFICLFAFAASAWAADVEVYRIDAFTGEVVDSVTGESTNYARIEADCIYNKNLQMYQFTTSAGADSDVCCSVYRGMLTTNSVQLTIEPAANVQVFRNGELLSLENENVLTEVGAYVIRNMGNESEVTNFTIVGSETGLVNSYSVPSIFYVSSSSYNGERYLAGGNFIDLSNEGEYSIIYQRENPTLSYQLDLTIDHTAPELEIIGVVDGIAKNKVTFGELEPGSTLVMQKDGEYIAQSAELPEPGQYVLTYTDRAGNSNTYEFKINVYFDGAAWIFLGLFVLILILGGGFMIYSRRNMRTR